MKIDKNKYIARFATEAEEHLEKMNEAILALEKNAADQEMLNLIFRSAHTIKGSSRMLGLAPIGELAHKLEDALETLKSGKMGAGFFDVVFRALDMIASMVEQAKSGAEITQDMTGILDELQRAAAGEPVVAGGGKPAAEAHQEDSVAPVPAEVAQEVFKAGKVADQVVQSEPVQTTIKAKRVETVRVDTSKLDEATKLVGEMVSNQSRLKQNLSYIESLRRESAKNLNMVSQANSAVDIADVIELSQKMNVMLKQVAMHYKNDLAYQSLLTEELLGKVTSMRMLPISTVLDTFHRSARDISASCGKKMELVTEGGETELDKTIIEKIGDPLLHMIRNSIDHGLESAEDRKRAGKPETGTIRISSGYDGSIAYINVSDDGGGIHLDKVKEKALQKKLYDKETLDAMPSNEILNLIFRPGFSTSAFITDISGRGVGMDVVKDTIVGQLKGSVHVQTEENKGTTFHIKLPLTLAIMRVFLVSAGDALFGLMVDSIVEVLKIKRGEIIDVVDKKAIRLREKLLPVVELRSILSLPEAAAGQDATVVMLSDGEEMLGVVVDTLVSEEDMEIKPLPQHMKNIGLVSGVSVTGKNDIAVVLNTAKIFAMAKDVKTSPAARVVKSARKAVHILVVDDSVNTREIERSILESYGYRVDVATDGQDGYEKSRNLQYDLVVTDVEMPRMDGFSLTEKLRKDAAYKHTPIVIVSSRDKEDDKRRGMQAGANAYIVKGSFEQSNLLSTVQALVEMLPEQQLY
ncbi:MAG: hybrid sensor histidine kinase/response regulator [Gallionella sp.]|nr:hybrid sensor histidine kinase/response regulator [Gallionella sp.]